MSAAGRGEIVNPVAENADNKAQRALTEKRLRILRVDQDSGLIVATCRGDTGAVYSLGYDPGKREFRCTCQASATFHRRCYHIRALQYCVAVSE